MIPNNLIITIDGPSGAGKSTVAKMIATSLHYTYIDTGAMYRGVAWAFEKRKSAASGHQQANSDDQMEKIDNLKEWLTNLDLKFEFENEARVYLDGEDISKKIREPDISMLASKLSQNKTVREHLYIVQRELGKAGGIVVEGRDTGSVVFPDAHVKFYLDANPEERAKRRHAELFSKGTKVDIASVREDMERRDKNDTERNLAPLIIPEGAIHVDTSGLDVKGVVEELYKHIYTIGEKWKQ
ncbi:MAG TPA: (d)CMP kinase [Syntrophorhabdus sp.]|jgi:cytidylate kinase|nr:(d)CMP kinase [Syntrophorhabdus sp.]HQB33473.1 (d)CMP kinase [Syntrophorhabdus sp.]